MKELLYTIELNCSKKQVWTSLTYKENYKKWASAFASNPTYNGKWEEKEVIEFIDIGTGGTKAILEKVQPCSLISARHFAIITPEGKEDRESDSAKKWNGTIEEYNLEEKNQVTKLSIKIITHEDFSQMYEVCWPKALETLKELCEK